MGHFQNGSSKGSLGNQKCLLESLLYSPKICIFNTPNIPTQICTPNGHSFSIPRVIHKQIIFDKSKFISKIVNDIHLVGFNQKSCSNRELGWKSFFVFWRDSRSLWHLKGKRYIRTHVGDNSHGNRPLVRSSRIFELTKGWIEARFRCVNARRIALQSHSVIGVTLAVRGDGI